MKNKLLFLLILVINSISIYSQNPSSIEYNFGANPYFDNSVKTIVYQTDSKIIVGGNFTKYNMTITNRIVRLNSDGQIDTTFNIGTGFNGNVNTIKIQSDGKILVGGNFTTFNGLYAYSIVRLNINGSIDSTFTNPIDLNGFSLFQGGVYGIGILSNGKILVSSSSDFWRINNNGTLDSTFNNSSIQNGGHVSNILIQSDEKIVIGKKRYNSDGSLDTSFDTTLNPMALQTDGKIICIESYDINVFTNQFLIKRLNINGTIDQSFNTGFALFNYSPNKIVVQNDGKILIGGDFTTYNQVNKNYILRLNTDGTLDNSFNVPQNVITPLLNGTVNVINEIVVQPDNKIIIGGGNNNFNKYVRLYNNGSKDNSYTGLDGIVECITLQSDNKILVGGSFNSYNGQSKNRLTRFNSNGEIDLLFDIGSGFNGTVNTIALQSDNKILVGGDFTSFNGNYVGKIARLNYDGSIDNTFLTGIGLNDRVNKISLQSDGKILIIGNFTLFNNSNANKIVRLSQNGSIDNTFNLQSNIDGVFFKTIAIQSDGKIYLGGYDFTNNSSSIGAIIKLNSNGTLDTGFSCNGIHSLQDVNDMFIETSGNILLAGNGGSNLTGEIVRISPSGLVINFTYNNIGNCCGAHIKSFVLQPDGKIIVGGYFESNSIVPSVINPIGILRLNPNFSIDSSFNYNSNSYTNNWETVNSVALQNDGRILVGGDFLYYNTYSFSSFLLRINGVSCSTATPIGAQTQTLCTGTTVADLTATGTNIKWYSTSTGGTELTSTTALENGTTYYASQTVNSCESTTRLAVFVSLNTTSTISLTTGNNYQYIYDGCPIQEIKYTLSGGATGVTTLGLPYWFDVTTVGNTVTISTNFVAQGQAGYYNFTITAIGGCGTTSVTGVISVEPIFPTFLNSPSGTDNQSICLGTTIQDIRYFVGSNNMLINYFVENLPIGVSYIISGQQIKISGTPSEVGVFNYQVINYSGPNCNININVGTITVIPTNAPTGATSQNFDYNATIADLTVTGTDIQWYSTSVGVNPLSSTTPLVNGTTYYASQTINGCMSQLLAVTVQIQLGTEAFNAIKISFSPNPVTNLFNINSDAILESVSIINIVGQTVYSITCNNTDLQLDLSTLSGGTYFVKVKSEEKQKIFKIIKN